MKVAVGEVERFKLVETARASRPGEPAISCACVAIVMSCSCFCLLDNEESLKSR